MSNLFTTATTVTTEQDAQVEKRLWQAVIVSTIQEWISGPLRYKRIAEEYLFQDRSDFPMVCQSAGLDVDKLRQQLTRLRTQANPLGKMAWEWHRKNWPSTEGGALSAVRQRHFSVVQGRVGGDRLMC
jgi:hypothetical protein